MATNITAITAGTPSKTAKQSQQFQGLFDVIAVKVALTDATLAAQVAGQVDVTVKGVELGDFVLVAYPADLTGCLIQAWVQAKDTITITTFNVEGTDAVTGMSGGLTANLLVLKPRGVFDNLS